MPLHYLFERRGRRAVPAAGVGFQLGCERFGAMAVPVGPGTVRLPWVAQAAFGASHIWAALAAGVRDAAASAASLLLDPFQVAPPTRQVSLRSDYELEMQRHNIRRAMRLGIWIWPSFTALDAYMCFVRYPGAPFPLLLIYRFVIGWVFVGVHRASARRHPEMLRVPLK